MDDETKRFWREACEFQRRQMAWTKVTNILVILLMVVIVVSVIFKS